MAEMLSIAHPETEHWVACVHMDGYLGEARPSQRPRSRIDYCVGHPWSMSCIISCAAFMSPTRSGGGEPAACIYITLATASGL